MKMQETETPEPSFGIVILLDALGISTYDMKQSLDFIRARDYILDNVKDHMKLFINSLDEEISLPNVRTFGDTVIITWAVGRDLVMKSLWPIADWLQKFIYIGFSKKLAWRGAISVGDFLTTENTVLGPAVADAAAWYEQAMCFGIILTPSLKYHLITAIEAMKPKLFHPERWFVEYQVPLKGNNTQKTWILAWPYLVYRSSLPPTPRAVLATTFWEFEIPKGTEHLYENTFEFFEWYGSEIYPKISDVEPNSSTALHE